MKLTEVIRRPLVTEKTTVLRDDGKTVVFEVSRDANKIDINTPTAALVFTSLAVNSSTTISDPSWIFCISAARSAPFST